MHYRAQSTGSVLLPKLIGSYESELWPVFEKVRQGSYDLFVDVGAAEGYYAVGVSKYIFKNRIATIAFEATDKGQKQISKLASLNHVHKITVKGYCDKTSLVEVLAEKRAFLVMDVEGGEAELLNPADNPALMQCDILVELHPDQVKGVCQLIATRFQQSHNIIHVNIDSKKKLTDQEKLPKWAKRFVPYMLNEFRGNQSWLFLGVKEVFV